MNVFERKGPKIVVFTVSALVALASYRYLIGVGPFAPTVLKNAFATPWLILHVAASATALLVGPLQFWTSRRHGAKRAHRWLGRLYVLSCLSGAISGFTLAFGTTAGPIATVGFGGMATAWFATTARGWYLARRCRIADHQAWMIRSWALTLAAVTFRLYLLAIPVFGLDFEFAYRAITFLCWIPNLLVAELYLHHRAQPRPARQAL